MKKCVWCLVALAAVAVPASADINGTFQPGAGEAFGAPGAYTTYSGGSTFANGNWTVTGNSVDWIGSYWQAPGDSYSVDLDGNAPGGITQSVSGLTSGPSMLNFYLAGNPDGPPQTKTVDVTVGSSSSTVTHGQNLGWTLEQVPFTPALTGPTTISFSSLDGQSQYPDSPWGPVVSNVSVTQGLQNGTFQPFTGTNVGSYTTVFAGGDTIQDWNVTGSVDLIGSYWQAPTAGAYSIDLDGDSPGGISQMVNFSPGQYVLTFYLEGNPDGPPPTKTVQVSVGGSSGIFQHPQSLDWTQESFDFTASGPETVSFASLDYEGQYSNDLTSPWGPVVGNISITQVPEAGFYSYSAFTLGLGGLLMLVRRKRQA